MGTYINPGNAAFKRISGPNYVDKTMLIELLNQRIPTENYLVLRTRNANPIGRKQQPLNPCLPISTWILTEYRRSLPA